MASDTSIKQLQDLLEVIVNIDKDKLLRASLGEEALGEGFASTLAEIQKKVEFVLQYAHNLHDQQIGNILSILVEVGKEFKRQADCSNVDYVARRQQFLGTVSGSLERLKQFWSPVVTAAVEARGFLDDEGVRREYEHTIESIKKESKTALQQVKEESNKTIEEARTLAKQIEDRARLTAAKISVEEAQKQFREAQAALDRRVKVWAVLGSVGVSGFLGVAIWFATMNPSGQGWQLVYYGAIKISVLTVIATTTAFCLKILRAHLHMSEKNRHRQRVANSMEAFVQSAATPEQRDLILSQLVESIVQFGHSGLVQREDDSVYRPKMTIDSITRTFPTNPQN